MEAHQVILQARQVILEPHQAILRPHQVIHEPQKAVLRPRQVISKARETIYKPRPVKSQPLESEFIARDNGGIVAVSGGGTFKERFTNACCSMSYVLAICVGVVYGKYKVRLRLPINSPRICVGVVYGKYKVETIAVADW